MVTRIFRVVFGFVMACIAAGLVKVLFAFSPAELSAMTPDRAADALSLTWPIATHMGIFAAPFALVAVALAEWRRWSDWTYYVIAAVAIAMVGFAAQYQAETATQGWSVLSGNYPLIAFLSAGAAGGLVYWIFSGHVLGGPQRPVVQVQPSKP